MPRDFISESANGFDLPNNFWIRARNAADTADLPLLRLNTSNGIELGGGSGAPLSIGSGDLVDYYVAAPDGLDLRVKRGTSGTPETTVGPMIRLNKTEQITEAAMAAAAPGGNGQTNEESAPLSINITNTANSEIQACAAWFGAKSQSTQSAHNDDACGIIMAGKIIGSGTGIGLGCYSEGRRDTSTGGTTGGEFRAANYTAVDGAYSPTTYSGTVGLLVGSGGNTGRVNGCGLQFHLVNSCQWDVGIGFPKYGSVSTIKNTSIRDDSDALTSIAINGTHSTGAILVAEGSGSVVVGGTTKQNANSRFEVQGPSSFTDPIIFFGHTTRATAMSIQFRNANGVMSLFCAGGTDSYMTGTAAGDVGILQSAATKKLHFGGTVSVIEITQDNKLGFFNNGTPVVKPTVSGAKGSNAALGSLMTALANLGLVTDSTSA